LLSYIDGRIALGKSNIFTSNLGEEALYAALGDRLASRICHMSQVIEFRGSDKRIYTQYSKN
jgi:DNA replication protein DnaC